MEFPLLISPPSRRRGLRGSCALIIGALSLPQLAAAQDAAVDLGTLVVESASGVETTLQDAPASVTVIDATTIEDQGARDLTDVLRTVPGLNLTRGNDGTNRVSFRGLSSNRTLMLVDGRRISSSNAMARHYQGDLSNIPVDAIDRIEVVRGPMSTLYGSDAMGGVINVILKQPTETWTGSVTAEYTTGQHDTTASSRQISGFASGALSKDLSLALWGKASEQDAPEPFTYTDENGDTVTTSGTEGSRVKELGFGLKWRPSDSMEWGLDANFSDERYVPGNGEPDSNKIQKSGIALSNEWYVGTGNLSSYLRFEHTTNAPWDADAGDWGTAIEYDTTTFETRYNDSTYMGGRLLEYTLGLSVQHDELTDAQTNRDNSLIEGDVLSGALYAEARYDLTDALRLTGGLRVDKHEEYGTHVTPRIYANYDFGNGLMLKAGYSQAFVAPDLRSLDPAYTLSSRGNGCKPYSGPCVINGNPDLEPETSDNYEIGLNYQGSGLSWEVTAFYNEVTNMLGARRTGEVTDTGFDIFERTNIDKGRTAGIEGGLSYALSDDLTMTNSFTWLALSEFEYDFLDEPYPMATTPEWNVTAGLSWQATDRLILNGSATYVGRQAGYVTEDDLSEEEANAVPAGQNSDPYTLVDIGASFEATDTIRVNFGIDNLFDKQPSNSVSYRENGRLFRIGVTTTF